MSIFRFWLQFNDSYAFRAYPSLTENQRIHQGIIPDMTGESRRGLRRCESCGELLAKWDEHLAGLVVKKRKYDIGITYDGIVVVSQRFISAYESSHLYGLVFRQLPDDPEFFAVQATRIVEFDAPRRGTRFVKQCPTCGRYESIVGATPVYLKNGQSVAGDEFVRTDLEFGSNDEKNPLLLCGKVAEESMLKFKLKGVGLCPLAESVSTS